MVWASQQDLHHDDDTAPSCSGAGSALSLAKPLKKRCARGGLSRYYSSQSKSFTCLDMAATCSPYGVSALSLAKRPSTLDLQRYLAAVGAASTGGACLPPNPARRGASLDSGRPGAGLGLCPEERLAASGARGGCGAEACEDAANDLGRARSGDSDSPLDGGCWSGLDTDSQLCNDTIFANPTDADAFRSPPDGSPSAGSPVRPSPLALQLQGCASGLGLGGPDCPLLASLHAQHLQRQLTAQFYAQLAASSGTMPGAAGPGLGCSCPCSGSGCGSGPCSGLGSHSGSSAAFSSRALTSGGTGPASPSPPGSAHWAPGGRALQHFCSSDWNNAGAGAAAAVSACSGAFGALALAPASAPIQCGLGHASATASAGASPASACSSPHPCHAAAASAGRRLGGSVGGSGLPRSGGPHRHRHAASRCLELPRGAEELIAALSLGDRAHHARPQPPQHRRGGSRPPPAGPGPEAAQAAPMMVDPPCATAAPLPPLPALPPVRVSGPGCTPHCAAGSPGSLWGAPAPPLAHGLGTGHELGLGLGLAEGRYFGAGTAR
ncbi:hypothetical protein HYH03_013544 [Edaphochlamys debaryana]|uniref:Uncharacterized protein n=1 Tax=Edaphochlamys debaryana TaxID=47281 RepID=A0A836BT78_9CHLO|nr:hypothetical protein HYH03_013544 [Edaphochlamys debaryana]|eukprot:KAG2487827.1 hypothetical protein HYH03_013544 [Edaphochlamys debaryana]